MSTKTTRPPALRPLRLAAALTGLWIVLFAGGGGSSRAIEGAGHQVDVAINHSPVALAVHAANNPNTVHLVTSVWEVAPAKAANGLPVYGLWLSPDCKDFSIAKGGKPRDKKIRSLAWVACRYAKEVAPTIIYLENVKEFAGWGPLLANGKRDPKRIGKTFRAWCAKLRRYGYVIEHRVLNAADYGAPTNRRRLFLVARRDGLPIVWPEPTHGKGRLPHRTAAECIDWSLPCHSIFLTKAEAKSAGLSIKRPLVDKTLWRIAQGLKRFLFESHRPFIIKVNHGKLEPRHESIDEPLSTVTAKRRGHALVVPILQQSGYGEREGQRARSLQLDLPLGTIVAAGQKHALVMAYISQYFGDPLREGGGGVVVGKPLTEPLPTITTRDHNSLVAVSLVKFRGTSESHSGAADIEEPLHTVSSGGKRGGVHIGLVQTFLEKFLGEDPQLLLGASREAAELARRGIVRIDGIYWQIVDICFRMLEPHELLAAQCGEYAADFDLSACATKAEQIELIGNMVCPHPAMALVRANSPTREAQAA